MSSLILMSSRDGEARGRSGFHLRTVSLEDAADAAMLRHGVDRVRRAVLLARLKHTPRAWSLTLNLQGHVWCWWVEERADG